MPDKPAAAHITVPYIEDANAKTAPYYSSTKSVEQAKSDVSGHLETLGGGILSFQGGSYVINGKQRFGFVIRFTLDVEPFNGAEGVIRVAGLPIRSHTPAKERQVKVQALLIIADWLKAAITSRVFSPDAHPLVPYLLVPGGDGQVQTVTEAVVQIVKKDVPLLVEGG